MKGLEPERKLRSHHLACQPVPQTLLESATYLPREVKNYLSSNNSLSCEHVLQSKFSRRNGREEALAEMRQAREEQEREAQDKKTEV